MSEFEYIYLRKAMTQAMRSSKALSPDSVLIDERDERDLLRYAEVFAELVQYYNLQNERAGDWKPFFPEISKMGEWEWERWWKSLGTNTAPQFALYLAFLEAFRAVQTDLNGITGRHLEFYLRKVLRLKNNPARADRVHIGFELARNVERHRIAKGTRLRAGKHLVYQTDDELVANTAQIGEIRSVFVDRREADQILVAPVANSLDGLGTAFPEDGMSWSPVGESQVDKAEGATNMVEAEIGMILASPILRLAEGEREVNFELGFAFEDKSMDLIAALEPLVTTELDLLFDGFEGLALREDLNDWRNLSVDQLRGKMEDQFGEMTLSFAQYLGGKRGILANYLAIGNVEGTAARRAKFRVQCRWETVAGKIELLEKILNSAAIYDGIFEVTFSGEKLWISGAAPQAPAPNRIVLKPEGPNATSTVHKLCIRTRLPISAAAVVDFEAGKLDGGYETNGAVARLIFKNHGAGAGLRSEKPSLYAILRALTIQTIDIQVHVRHVRNLVLQSDDARIDPTKPFHPFGLTPALGASFWIGSKEIFSKRLQNLKLHLDWMELPAKGFTDHYANYGKTLTWDSFKANAFVLKNKTWTPAGTAIGLFPEYNQAWTSTAVTINRVQVRDKVLAAPDLPAIVRFEHALTQGFVRLELSGHDFGHPDYINILAANTIKLSKQGAPDPNAFPKQPYTPQVKSIELEYTATATISLEDRGSLAENEAAYHQRSIQFFHRTLFGHQETHPYLNGPNNALDGKFQVRMLPVYDQEGYLYLGLNDLHPPENITIHFHAEEGSADANFRVPRKAIRWWYLSDSEWVELPELALLSDSTYGFITTGIVKQDLPKTLATSNPMLPRGLHWIRASIAENTKGIARMISLGTQYVQASYVDQGQEEVHATRKLAPAEITRLAVRDAAIKSIVQPLASFKGRPREEKQAFYTRASERLRHKRRAISPWDFERMVLEKFPSIYQAKCLSYTGSTSAPSPGDVTLVVIPDIRNRNGVNLLKPQADYIKLVEIEDYIRRYASTWANVKVINPEYDKVRLDFSVKFGEGRDEGFYGQQLNKDIVGFLAPWTTDRGTDISFGGSIYKSAILQFIEERNYVDYVTNFEFFQHNDDGIGYMEVERDFRIYAAIEVAQAFSPRTVLTSAAQHNIHVISIEEELEMERLREGVGKSSIGPGFNLNELKQ